MSNCAWYAIWVVHWGIFSQNATVYAKVDCSHLHRSVNAHEQLAHFPDVARQLVVIKMSRQMLHQLGWKRMFHSSQNHNITPSDWVFLRFRLLFWYVRWLDKMSLKEIFASRHLKFWREKKSWPAWSIEKKLIESDENYSGKWFLIF